jgi:pheromone shutdown protein TraB
MLLLLLLFVSVVFNYVPSRPEDIEKCKEKDTFESIMEELTGNYPELSRVFISERDTYLAHSLQVASSPDIALPFNPLNLAAVIEGVAAEDNNHPSTGDSGRVVVGIVGLGHVQGIKDKYGTVKPDQVIAVMQ